MAWMGRKRALLSWSGGKDAAMALKLVQTNSKFELAGLVSTVDEKSHRVPIHGVSEELLDRQAHALNLPLTVVGLPQPCPNSIYEQRLADALRAEDAAAVAFGDLFLSDIKTYREQFLQKLGIEGVFPLWGRTTRDLAGEIIQTGFKTVLCSVDARVVPETWLGKPFDDTFLANLPKNVDPCGENGEFHTFTWAGPNFASPIRLKTGAIHAEGNYRWIELTAKE